MEPFHSKNILWEVFLPRLRDLVYIWLCYGTDSSLGLQEHNLCLGDKHTVTGSLEAYLGIHKHGQT